jgi:deazaflavin-dependent oxidoreductase (nitroreductase family)
VTVVLRNARQRRSMEYGAIVPNGARKGSGMPLTGEYEPSTADWARRQVDLYESSGGTEGTTLRGMPVIVLTSVGAKSGKLRKTALMRVEHDGEYAVVASLGGAPKNPVWYFNLLANPHVELQDGPVKRDFTAREVTGDERSVWWARAVAAYPDYADYQERTSRQIPVLVLTALAAETA